MFAANFSVVDIKAGDDQTIVTIKPKRSLFFKVIVSIFIFPLIAAPVAFLIFLVVEPGFAASGLNWILIPGAMVVLTLFWYKYMKRNFSVEKLTFSKGKLMYQHTLFGLGKYFDTEYADIKDFKHLNADEPVTHPLEITGDALNFGVPQREINYLNQSGTLLLETEYHSLQFGADVDEEDYLRMKQLIDNFKQA